MIHTGSVCHAPGSYSECELARADCEPRINNVGSGATNVSLASRTESMIVGQRGCSIASRAFFHCKPQHLPCSGMALSPKVSGAYAFLVKAA